MEPLPKLSVVVATLNRELALERTLSYFLFDEEYPDFDIIVIDQSDTHEPRLLSFLSEHMDRISYTKVRYKSLTKARNEGLRLSSGDIVVFVDDDVDPCKGFLNAHLRPYSRPDVVCVTGPAIAPVSRVLLRAEISESEYDDLLGKRTMRFDVDFSFEAQWAIGCNMSFRKSIFSRVGYFDENFIGSAVGEDAEMSHRINRSGGIIRYEPDARLIHYQEMTAGCRSWVATGKGIEASVICFNYFRYKIGIPRPTRYKHTIEYCLSLLSRNRVKFSPYVLKGLLRSEWVILRQSLDNKICD